MDGTGTRTARAVPQVGQETAKEDDAMHEQGRTQTAKQRVGWVDIAKGIAILFVIWGHAMRDPMRMESAALDYSYRVISAFHNSTKEPAAFAAGSFA